jgi:hypothetical protein
MRKNIVEPDRPQMTIWRMRIACWTTKATNTHSQYVIFVVFLLQQWFHERAPVSLYSTLPALLVSYRPRPCSPVRNYQGLGIAYCLHLECWKYQVGDSAVSHHNLNIQFSLSFVKHDAMKEDENVRARTTAQRIPNFNIRQAWEQTHDEAVRPWGTSPQKAV